MTVSNDVNKSIQTGNGVTTSFPFTFQVSETDGSDISIYITNVTTGITSEPLSSNYLVTLNDPSDLTAGGVVTYPYPVSGTKLQSTEKITIIREMDILQNTHYTNSGPFMAETVESDLDKVVMQIQQMNESLERAILADISVTNSNYTLPSPVAEKAIGWNEAGTGLINYDLSSVPSINQIKYNNIAAMKAATPPTANYIAFVEGYYEPGDGGGGMFFYDLESSEADNKGTIIISNSSPSIGRWIRIINEDYINVKWFGAKGDGVSDDTAAIQAAIDNSNGLEILFSDDFIVNGTLTVANNNKLRMTKGSITQTKNNTILIYGNAVSNVVIRDMKLIGKKTDYRQLYDDGAKGISFINSNNIIIKDCYLNGFSYAGIHFSGVMYPSPVNATNFIISNNTVIGTGSLNLVLGSNHQFGIYVGFYCKKGLVQGNNISNTAHGFFAAIGTNDVSFVDNFVHDIISQHGFYIDDCTKLTINNNLLSNIAYAGIKFQQDANAINVAGETIVSSNTIKTCGVQGILVSVIGEVPSVVPYGNEKFLISNNYIEDCVSDAVAVEYITDAIISNNMCLNTRGIRVAVGANIMIIANDIRNCLSNGITLAGTCSKIKINNNTIETCGLSELGSLYQCGIVSFGGAGTTFTDVIIDNNEFRDSGATMLYALYFASGTHTDIRIRDNVIKGNVRMDATGLSVSGLVEWNNNYVSGTLTNLIYPIYGRRNVLTASAAPSSGTWKLGDTVYNTAPAAAGYIGWVCTVAGTPGTWKGFGVIQT